MGFLDKIKQAANFVTGGGAKVTVETAEGTLDGSQPIAVTIHATVKDASINARRVYLKVRARETVYVSSEDFPKDGEGGSRSFEEHHVHYDHEIDVSGEQELEANESYNWEASFTLPDHVFGTFQGRWGKHEIQIQGALDTKGNDPDSGWVTIHVRK